MTGAAGAAFAARAAVFAPVGAAAALVGANVASVETAPATDGPSSAPAETKVVPVGKFAALKPGSVAVFSDAEAAPIEEPAAHKVEGALAASTRYETAPGDGSAARTPDGAVAAFAEPVEGFAASDNAVEETTASATGGVAGVGFTMPCKACVRDLFLHDSPVLLIVTHAEDDSCTLYLTGWTAVLGQS